ncbi:MAG: dienelactone hydrolase family protein [Holosporales bacterium]|jgi:phospholipase/carboxylesterase|nr:dienelactone hydrolase family protein [Holosporales bacterium]
MASGLGGSVYGPCSGQKPRSLVVLFHGYGANADDLIPLAYTWGPHLPESLFISLNAPAPHPTMSFGRQWFPMDNFDLARIWDDVTHLASPLKVYLDETLAKNALSYRDVVFVGFSQGAVVALHEALYILDVAGAISYSGFLVPHSHGMPPKSKPILLVHGDCDNVLPISFLSDAQKILKEGQVPFEAWVCEGLGHGISPFGLEKGRVFLQRVLKAHPTKI